MSAQGWALLLDSIQKRKEMEFNEREVKRKAAADYIKQLEADADKRIAQDMAERELELRREAHKLALKRFGHEVTQAELDAKSKADKATLDLKNAEAELARKTSTERASQMETPTTNYATKPIPLGMAVQGVGDDEARRQLMQTMISMEQARGRIAPDPMMAGAEAGTAAMGELGQDMPLMLAPWMQQLSGMIGGAKQQDLEQRAGQLYSEPQEQEMKKRAVDTQLATANLGLLANEDTLDRLKITEGVLRNSNLSAKLQQEFRLGQLQIQKAELDVAEGELNKKYGEQIKQHELAKSRLSEALMQAQLTKLRNGPKDERMPVARNLDAAYKKSDEEYAKQIADREHEASEQAVLMGGYDFDGYKLLERKGPSTQTDYNAKRAANAMFLTVTRQLKQLREERAAKKAEWNNHPYKKLLDIEYGGKKPTPPTIVRAGKLVQNNVVVSRSGAGPAGISPSALQSMKASEARVNATKGGTPKTRPVRRGVTVKSRNGLTGTIEPM